MRFCPLWIVAPVVGIISIWPWFFLALNGDNYHHYMMIDCFAGQLWSGHLYPRWCMNANAGYGSPIPLFYIPLPYYLTALFYPLRHVGLEAKDFLVMGFAVAATLGFASTTMWLRSVTTHTRAMFCAFILCWLGYRTEMATFRTAYPELLCAALLPWVFLEVRRLTLDKGPRWARLALLITLCMLTHILAALIGLAACGIYLLVVSPRRMKHLLWLAFATLLAVLATLFHWAQYMQFVPFLSDATLKGWREGWANNYLTMENIYTRLPVLLISYLHAFIFVFLIGHVMRKPELIEDRFIRRELCAWMAIGVVALCLMFPASQPVWNIVEATVHVRAPWRMQLLTMFGFVFLLAVFSRYYWGVVMKRTGDVACFALFMMLLSATTLYPTVEGAVTKNDMLLRRHYMLDVVNTRWTADKYIPFTFFKAMANGRPAENVQLVEGSGTVQVTQWNDDAIKLHVETQGKARLRLEQFYFPLWRASVGGRPVELTPEEGLGRMFIEVPAGKSEVVVRQELMAAMPANFRLVCALSLASILLMLGGLCRSARRAS